MEQFPFRSIFHSLAHPVETKVFLLRLLIQLKNLKCCMDYLIAILLVKNKSRVLKMRKVEAEGLGLKRGRKVSI